MSQLERLVEEKKDRAARKNAVKRNGASSGYVVFRPTKEERDEIRKGGLSVSEAMSLIGTFVQDGHKFGLGFKPENEAYYALIREGGADFENAVCLSCWHSDVAIAIVGLAYGLQGRHSKFPNIQTGFWNDFDW